MLAIIIAIKVERTQNSEVFPLVQPHHRQIKYVHMFESSTENHSTSNLYLYTKLLKTFAVVLL
jgi:hypothetical protein